MRNSLLTGILMIIGVLIPKSDAQGIEFFKGSWEEALEEAALQKKIIFVDAYAVWCGPCKRMSRDVFPNEKVGAFYNANFINLKMDMERGEGLQFRKKYPVTAFPTLFYISSDGEIVYTTKGARGVDQFLQLGQQVVGQYDESPKYAEEYEAGNRDPELIYNYIKALNEAGKSSLKISNDYLYGLSPEEMDTEFNLRFIFEAAVEADSRIFELLVEYRSAIESLTSAEQVSERIRAACEATVSKAVQYESRTLLEEASSKMAAHAPEMAKAFAQRAEMQFAVAAGNAAGFIQAAKSYSKLPEGNTPEELHATAQMLVKEFESDEDAVALAIKLAGKAVKADGASKRLIFLALLQDLGGQRKKAMKTLEKVLKSPDNATDERRARQLLESLQAE